MAMGPKDADRIANSVDPDQIQSDLDFTLFAWTCLSKTLGSLQQLYRYFSCFYFMNFIDVYFVVNCK